MKPPLLSFELMRFRQLVLTNYRSFEPDRVEFDLPEAGNLLALVGANNAGKSNIVDAFRIVLGQHRPSPPAETDFWRRNTEDELRIELFLREPLKLVNIYKGTDTVTGLYYRAWRRVQADERGILDSEHYSYDEKGETYVPPATVGGKKQPEPDAVPRPWRPAPASEVIRKLGPVYFFEPSLTEAFRLTGRGALARLLDLCASVVSSTLESALD